MFEILNSSAAGKPSSAVVLHFPPRGRYRFDVRVERETDAAGWFVLLPDRGHGWLHGSFDTALSDAREIARGFGVSITSSAGRWTP